MKVFTGLSLLTTIVIIEKLIYNLQSLRFFNLAHSSIATARRSSSGTRATAICQAATIVIASTATVAIANVAVIVIAPLCTIKVQIQLNDFITIKIFYKSLPGVFEADFANKRSGHLTLKII